MLLSIPLVVLAAVSIPRSAGAVDLEPYVFFGTQDGGVDFSTGIACVAVIGVQCPTSASTEDGDDDVWGLGLALRVAGPWWMDLRWSDQQSEAHFFDTAGDPVARPAASFDVSHLHAGALYRFRDGRWSPFLTAFAGIASIDSEASTFRQSSIDLTRTSGGVGGGLLLDLGSRLGLRAEVRGIRTDMPDEFDGDLDQVQASAALRLRI